MGTVRGHHRCAARPRAGFSLVELLVVIAIIAVMVGLLLPGLAGAREGARRVECASNLRQLATASHAYADDYRGLMPPGASDMLGNLSRWHGSRSHPSERFRSDGGSLSEYLGSGGTAPADAPASPIRRCASFLPVLRSLSDSGAGFELACGGYGYNNAFVGVQRRRAASRWVVVSDRAGSPLAGFDRPGSTIAFSDTAFASDAGVGGVIEYSFVEPRFWPDAPGARAEPSMHFRHGGSAGSGGAGEAGGAGVAWLDTHVTSERMTFSWSSGLYGVDAAEVGVGFTGSDDDNTLYGED